MGLVYSALRGRARALERAFGRKALNANSPGMLKRFHYYDTSRHAFLSWCEINQLRERVEKAEEVFSNWPYWQEKLLERRLSGLVPFPLVKSLQARIRTLGKLTVGSELWKFATHPTGRVRFETYERLHRLLEAA